jgi:hypothetical protein
VKTDTFEVHQVHHMPRDLVDGVLYVSRAFELAIHLCPCGCRERVITPLGPPTGWGFDESGPTLSPSISNPHAPCRSHYWIVDGKVRWA